jgi:hypothetical protein
MAAVGGGCCWRFLSLIIRIVAAAGVAAAGKIIQFCSGLVIYSVCNCLY